MLRLAESVNTYQPLGPGDVRIERPGWVLWLGSDGSHPAFTVVQRFRLRADEVEASVAEIRALLAERGRARSTWEVGPSATPPDLVERLLSLGMTRFEEPVAAGMVLRRPLPALASDVVARPATTVDDFVAAFDVLHPVFGERSETAAERRARAERELEPERSTDRAIFLGLLDGEPVAAAVAVCTPHGIVLGGGATLPAARGRGAYRALVAARYDEAVRRGTPTLVVQAGAMSRPILARLGFETVAEVQILLDEAHGGG